MNPEIVIYNQPDCILPKSFFEGRFMPNLHPESLDYEQWCQEQTNRCLYGYKDGGFSVTGVNYYHLNFRKIRMLDKMNRRTIMHPYYSFEDQELFNDIKQAQDDQQGMMLITGGGFGKSFSAASLVEHTFTLFPATECIISSSKDRAAELLWEKVELGLDTQPTWMKAQLLSNTSTLKYSGWSEKDPITKQERDEGFKSIIRKVVYDHDPEKTRGSRASIHVWEEVGSWVGAARLLDCWKKTERSWWIGSKFACFPLLIGTGGAMDTGGSVDAKMMFYHPDLYNLKVFEYQNEKIAKFYPAYVKCEGYYEKSGVSDTDGAMKFLQQKRKRKENNPELFRQETMEFPINHKEVFQVNGSGLLPIQILENRFVAIERDENLQLVQNGNLDFVYEGSRIIDMKWEPNENGIFQIVEHPVWTRKDWKDGKMAHLYVAGCDSFDAVEEENGSMRLDKSPGCDIIFKRFWKASETGRLFVAKVTQRTDDATEFYWNTVKLNMYYNAKMLAEYTKIGIFQHYIQKGFEYMLYPRPRLDASVVQKSEATHRYGIQMPGEVKIYIIKRYGQYLRETQADQMYFPSLLLDGAEFSFEGRDKGKHDETMAASIALLADEDMYKALIRDTKTTPDAWPKFVRNSQGKLVFQ